MYLFGIETPLVIAGPCSAESEAQTLATAKALAALGISVFRAGVWKPRTKPGGFEGRGAEALEWLRRVKETTGMKVITEVANASHLRLAAEAGLDGVWIGARTSANPFAVQEIADAISALPADRRKDLTVLVKNPVNPDLELWVGAIERVRGSGAGRIAAIHRGFSSYGKHLYRNPPRWAIPIELGRRFPDLPIIFDPSHVAGRANLVERLALQSMGMNFAGLMIEAHNNPAEALSDAAQQLTPEAIGNLLLKLDRRRDAPTTDMLEALRLKIDSLDDQLLDILARRMEVSREIGEYKRIHRLPVVQFPRYKALMEQRVAHASALSLPPEFVRNILASIHEESVRQQLDP